jgi:hypothetical protein
MRIDQVLAEREKGEPGITERIEGKIDSLTGPATGRQARQNLWAEELVVREEWNCFIDAVRDCPDDPPSVQATVSQVMSDHKLRGRAAKCATTTVFGRAVTEASLAKAFHGGKKTGSDLYSRRMIRFAMSLITAEDLRTWLEDFPLGEYVMWCTFNADGREPFVDLPDSADGIRAALGLSKLQRTQPLLLLQYTLDAGVAVMPRVTEAYAGPVWTHYFRPAGRPEQKRGYGRTFPWDELAEEQGAGEPEVVHEPVRGDRLVARIEQKR